MLARAFYCRNSWERYILAQILCSLPQILPTRAERTTASQHNSIITTNVSGGAKP